MLNISDHGGSFGGGISKGKRMPFEKTSGKQPILRWVDIFGDSYDNLAWGGFYYDKEKQSAFWIFNNFGHQWRQYKIGGHSTKFGGGVNVTPTTAAGSQSSIPSSQVARIIKYNNKYFVFYTNGLSVVDAITMKILSEHTSNNHKISNNSNLMLRGNFAYFNIASSLVRIDLDNPSVTPVIIGSASGQPAVVDKNREYFYRISNSNIVKFSMANAVIYTKSLTAGGETFYSNMRGIAFHPNGNIVVFTLLNNRPNLIVVDPITGGVISRHNLLDVPISTLDTASSIDITQNHIILAGNTYVSALDLNFNQLWYESKQALNEHNLTVCNEYVMWTWDRYVNTSSYANLFYELEILI
ncbi:hypothetical protein IIE26_05220 [Cytobacillus oceanisediminis]|uniref:hypothetical protein n=1 Tax=Cytobacillus oceanisediminis TaxID=665099 RepID=UPI00186493D8|nr:hypothetical protein [Cytobacillus oceanisediminis]QOK28070.1 hypothetical protein IIE26_05220 [Cytobacillus oceanisediminis]